MCAFSPAQVQYAQEVREYSLGVLGGSMCLYAFFAYINRGKIWPLVLVAFIVPFLSYGTIFLVVSLGLVLVIFTVIRSDFDYKISIAASAFISACLATYTITAKFQSNEKRWYLEQYYPPEDGSTSDILIWLIWSVYDTFMFNLGNHWVILTLLAVSSIFLWFSFLRIKENTSSHKSHSGRYIFLALFILLLIQIAAATIEIYPFGGIRHVIYMGPLVYLCIAIMLNDLLFSDKASMFTSLISIVNVSVFLIFNILAMPKAYAEVTNVIRMMKEHIGYENFDSVYFYYRGHHTLRFHLPNFTGVIGEKFDSDPLKYIEDIMSANLPCRKYIVFMFDPLDTESKIITGLLDRGFPEPQIFQGIRSNIYEFDSC